MFERLVGRIRLLIGMGLSLPEVYRQVMTGDNRPNETDFFLAYKGAETLIKFEDS